MLSPRDCSPHGSARMRAAGRRLPWQICTLARSLPLASEEVTGSRRDSRTTTMPLDHCTQVCCLHLSIPRMCRYFDLIQLTLHSVTQPLMECVLFFVLVTWGSIHLSLPFGLHERETSVSTCPVHSRTLQNDNVEPAHELLIYSVRSA